MKTRITLLILSAVLSASVLTSCSLFVVKKSLDNNILDILEKKEEEPAENEETLPEEENIVIIPEEKAEEVEEKEEVIDYTSQIELIAATADEWFEFDSYNFYSYCVTDRDNNGRLEIISGDIGGTGMFTMADIYEVSPELDSIIPCCEKGTINIDITSYDVCDVYTDNGTGTKYYALSDGFRAGWAEQGSTRYALYIKDSVYYSEVMADYLLLTDEDFNETTYYYDGNGNEVNEEYFENCYDIVFEGCDKSTASFGWINGEKNTESWGYILPGHDELVKLLTESFEIFNNN